MGVKSYIKLCDLILSNYGDFNEKNILFSSANFNILHVGSYLIYR